MCGGLRVRRRDSSTTLPLPAGPSPDRAGRGPAPRSRGASAAARTTRWGYRSCVVAIAAPPADSTAGRCLGSPDMTHAGGCKAGPIVDLRRRSVKARCMWSLSRNLPPSRSEMRCRVGESKPNSELALFARSHSGPRWRTLGKERVRWWEGSGSLIRKDAIAPPGAVPMGERPEKSRSPEAREPAQPLWRKGGIRTGRHQAQGQPTAGSLATWSSTPGEPAMSALCGSRSTRREYGASVDGSGGR